MVMLDMEMGHPKIVIRAPAHCTDPQPLHAPIGHSNSVVQFAFHRCSWVKVSEETMEAGCDYRWGSRGCGGIRVLSAGTGIEAYHVTSCAVCAQVHKADVGVGIHDVIRHVVAS